MFQEGHLSGQDCPYYCWVCMSKMFDSSGMGIQNREDLLGGSVALGTEA